jgi:hypothetical protein
MRIYLFILFYFLCFSARSQNLTGAGFTALANAGVALSDVWSTQQNQAGLAKVKSAKLALAFENSFLQADLTKTSAVFSLPYQNNTFGLSCQHYGFDSYAEQKAGIGLARNFGTELALALNFNFHTLKIRQYGSSSNISFDVGMQYSFSEHLTLGIHVANPTRSAYQANLSAIIPSIYRAGLAYIFSDKITLAAEVSNTMKYGADLHTGMAYQLFDILTLRGGFSAKPFKHYAGFGLHYQQFFLDVAASSHPVLGYSPQIALAYEF